MEVASHRRTETLWAGIIDFAHEISVTEWKMCKVFFLGGWRRGEILRVTCQSEKNFVPHRRNIAWEESSYQRMQLVIPKTKLRNAHRKQDRWVGEERGGERNRMRKRETSAERERQRVTKQTTRCDCHTSSLLERRKSRDVFHSFWTLVSQLKMH